MPTQMFDNNQRMMVWNSEMARKEKQPRARQSRAMDENDIQEKEPSTTAPCKPT
jgi:hypothetical protein